MRSLVIAVVLCCAAALPGTAEAQFGKLGAKIARKAGVAPAAGGEKVEIGKVSFNDAVLEITDERVTRFIRGLDAEKAMAAKVDAQDTEGIERRNDAARAAHNKAAQAYQKKHEAWEKCASVEEARTEKEMQGVAGEAPDQATMDRLAARMKAARDRGDMAEIQRLADSIGRSSMALSAKAQGVAGAGNAAVLKNCGPEPVEPERAAQESLLTFQDVRNAGLAASGFTDGQYSIMRERILPFIVSKGKSGGGMVYTETEVTVLTARLADLSAYAELMQKY